MTNFPLTIAEAATALRAGDISSVALVAEMLDRADHLDGKIGTYIQRLDETALTAAADADAKFAAGVDLGPLQGIPLGIKDIISTDEAPTTAQSLVLDPAWGARGDGPVMKRLRAAGAIVMGKLTTMEFATGLPDPEKPFPIPRNPWDTATWPGGSSSGTGNGIAAGLFLGGLGTDTGGSVRMPACLCGITGMKQTFGRVPKSGCVPLGYSLDHIGPMARTARDCAIMLDVMAGYDASDPSAADVPVPSYTAGLGGSIKGMRMGVERANHLAAPGVIPEVVAAFEAAVQVFADAGAEIVEITIPHYAEILSASMVSNGESLAYHMPDLRTRWADYGRQTSVAVAMAAFYSSADYVQAQRVRRYARSMMTGLMANLDVVLTPTMGTDAPLLEGLDLMTEFLEGRLLINTPFWNALGFPAMSVPMGFSQRGLPLGLQIASRPFDEATAFLAGDAYQSLTSFHLAIPPIAALVPA